MGRKPLGKKTRFEIFKRDGFACQYCGATPPKVVLQVDHIVAVAAGGANDMDNLITSCQPCNIGKGANDLSVAPQSLADKAEEVREREEQLLGYQAILEARRQRIEDETWRVLQVLDPGVDRVPVSKFQSVKRFVSAIGVYETLEAAEITFAKFRRGGSEHSLPFKYFCGICWKKSREAVHG